MNALTKLIIISAGIFSFYPAWPETKTEIFPQSNDSISLNHYRVMQVSLVPYFGTNGYLSDSIVNDISFNILSGSVYEVRYFEMGTLLNFVHRNCLGFEVAGIGNFVGGRARGFQGAGMVNAASAMGGVQIAGLTNYTKEANCIQLAGLVNQAVGGNANQVSGLVNNSGKIAGFQVAGLVNNAHLVKLQIGGLLNNAQLEKSFQDSVLVNNSCYYNTLQIAGLTNRTSEETGIQISGLANHARSVKNLQLAGLVNNSRDVSGIQISGLVNNAKYVKGAQIGVVNIADSINGIPIGVFNFIKNGYHKLEISADEMFYTNIAYHSGTRQFHSVVTAGIDFNNLEMPLWTYGTGIGTTTAVTQKVNIDIDILFQNVIKGGHVDNNYLYKVNLGLDWHLSGITSIYIGASYNFLVVDLRQRHYTEYYSDIAPYSIYNLTTSHHNLREWIGFKAGVRFF
jgi:hypothetical protein